MNPETINVNLHGHLLPDFGGWWKKQCGIEGQNLAKVVTDKCIEKMLDICTVTDNPNFWKSARTSRFNYMFDYARALKKEDSSYKLGKLGESDNAFVVEKNGKQVYFLDGQSLTIRGEESFELLTFGRSGIKDFSSLDEAFTYLKGEGLPAIAEHALVEVHYGAMNEKFLEELCSSKRLTTVEYNAKISLKKIFSLLPKFKGYTRERNEKAVEIARRCKTPVVANDDSNEINQIATAYSIFPKAKIRTSNGEAMTQDLIKAIQDNDFSIFPGYLPTSEWMKFVIWHLTIKQKILGCKKRYEVKYELGD